MKILQISDIHWKVCSKWEENFAEMKVRFLDDMQQYRKKYGRIDYLFICGDIAFKGCKDEYDLAADYISEICKAIGCEKEDVFVVPGKHDLNRKAEGNEKRQMLNHALAFDAANEKYLKTILKEAHLAKMQYEPFRDYNEFAKEYICHEHLMNKCLSSGETLMLNDNDQMCYHAPLKKEGDFKVSITGVNTALNCDEYDWNDVKKEGHMQMLPRRAYYTDEISKQEIKIIMGHHPISYLTSKDAVQEYLDHHYHIQLFGHVHELYYEGENSVRILSGAFDPPKDKKDPDKYRPTYNIIEMKQTGRDKVKVSVETQIWEKTQFKAYEKSPFEKDIRIELDVNKWENEKTMENSEIDAFVIKKKYIGRPDRTSFFKKMKGIEFSPIKGNSQVDDCLDFVDRVEETGRLQELWYMMNNE